MKQINLPAQFDGAKFATRYGLSSMNGDFFVRDGILFFPSTLPDVPVLEAPTPKVPLKDRIAGMTPNQVAQNLKDILLEMVNG
jgi:hypothetical protein